MSEIKQVENPRYGYLVRWLITGGAGYLGSAVVNLLTSEGFEIAVLDISDPSTASYLSPGVKKYKCDIKSIAEISDVFNDFKPEGLVHLAALKSLHESFLNPKLYFETNVEGTKQLVDVAIRNGCKKIIFSSSAAVYSNNGSKARISENFETLPSSPYGVSKLLGEAILADASNEHKIQTVTLRLFNLAGKSKFVNKDFADTNFISVLSKSLKSGEKIILFGSDYETIDGTCVRDYLHVDDAAEIIKEICIKMENGNIQTPLNVGTGVGVSLLEIISCLEKEIGRKINFEFRERREGDIEEVVSNNSKITNYLKYKKWRNINEIISSIV